MSLTKFYGNLMNDTVFIAGFAISSFGWANREREIWSILGMKFLPLGCKGQIVKN